MSMQFLACMYLEIRVVGFRAIVNPVSKCDFKKLL